MRVEDFLDPYLGQSWGSLGATVQRDGDRITVGLGYPARGIQADAAERLAEFLGLPTVDLALTFKPDDPPAFEQVKHLVLIASGKGGVGKSTSAINLALGLAAEGANVGLLDADIYGPSQGMMLGIEEGRRPEIVDGKYFEPVSAHGLKAMSMSLMTTDKTPMIWRGPMASGALQQILGQTLWGELDYLIVDMPPGTGDIQLTLAQQAPCSGAVIVTTPQDIALLDARKGVGMFAKVDIPVLGILENMSVHQCESCGHVSHPFGDGGGQQVAEELGVPLLGQLPLSLSLREQSDGGSPMVSSDPESLISGQYRDAARHLAARLWAAQDTDPGPSISMVED